MLAMCLLTLGWVGGMTRWGDIGMKSFFRDNPTIAFGLALPVLLVVVFLLGSGIPTLLVAPPKYDVLFATDYYSDQQGLQMAVVGQQLRLSFRGPAQRGRLPRLWRYYAKTGAVQEIGIVLPSSLAAAGETGTEAPTSMTSVAVAVPDLQGVVVDSSSIAPDGYAFNSASDRYPDRIFGGLFYSSRYHHQVRLEKNGRRVRLPYAGNDYYRHSTRFIGWVVSP